MNRTVMMCALIVSVVATMGCARERVRAVSSVHWANIPNYSGEVVPMHKDDMPWEPMLMVRFTEDSKIFCRVTKLDVTLRKNLSGTHILFKRGSLLNSLPMATRCTLLASNVDDLKSWEEAIEQIRTPYEAEVERRMKIIRGHDTPRDIAPPQISVDQGGE